MEDKQILTDLFNFHGHKCWASTAGLRAGLANIEQLSIFASLP